MATIVGKTSAAIDAIQAALEAELADKADLVGGVIPDDQAPAISVKKDTILINVKDHGAVGDGVTSDSAAMIAAIAAINTTYGGKVYFPPGKYKLDGANPLNLLFSGMILEGAGAMVTQIVIDSTFTGAEAVYIAGKSCQVKNLSIVGSSSTTTSNPVCGAIKIYGTRRAKIKDCEFWNINGWAVEAIASTTDASGNPDGTMLSGLMMRQCAGGVHFKGNTISGYAVNSFMTDIEILEGGVSTGASAGLDNVMIEDSWDVLIANLMSWKNVGTGSCLDIAGNCAAIFVKTIDALGPSTGACVLIQDGTNGSAQNVQIEGGVVQQGLYGLRTTGMGTLITVLGLRVINNNSHGVSIESGQPAVNLFGLNFSGSGNGASGTNYDLNWSGSATGIIDGCRFSSPIVATGVAGVQQSINMSTTGQNVRCVNIYFTGSGSTSSNWFTNTPSAVLTTNLGTYQFLSPLQLKGGVTATGNYSAQPGASGNTVFSSNTNGSSSFDNYRLTGDGTSAAGTGSAARDTSWGRQGVAQFGTADSDIVIGLLGKGLRVKSGTNGRVQTATLAAGSVTIANSSITSTTCIIPFYKTPGGTHGALYVDAVTVGTSCVVKSTNAADTSTIGILLVEAI